MSKQSVDVSVPIWNKKLWSKYWYFLKSSFWQNTGLYKYNTLHTHQTPSSVELFLFTKIRIHLKSKRFEDTKIINMNENFTGYQKRNCRGALINEKFTGISILNDKGTILKKMNVSFIVSFCLGKYNFNLNFSLTHLIFRDNHFCEFCFDNDNWTF